MADPATPKRTRKPKQTGLFAETTAVKINIPKPILESLQRDADADVLPLDIYLVRQLAKLTTKPE